MQVRLDVLRLPVHVADADTIRAGRQDAHGAAVFGRHEFLVERLVGDGRAACEHESRGDRQPGVVEHGGERAFVRTRDGRADLCERRREVVALVLLHEPRGSSGYEG